MRGLLGSIALGGASLGCATTSAPREAAVARARVAQAAAPATDAARPLAAPPPLGAAPPPPPGFEPMQAAMPLDARPPGAAGAIFVSFEVDDDEHPWVVLGRRGELVCQLPCQVEVGYDSGLSVRRADTESGSYQVSVPKDPGFLPGSRVVATILPKRGSEVGPAIMLYAGGSISAGVLGAGVVCLAVDCDISKTASAGLVIGSSVYITGATWWFFWTRRLTKTEWEYQGGPVASGPGAGLAWGRRRAQAPAQAPDPVTVGPGFVTVETGRGEGVVVGPGFAMGAF